MFSYTSYKNLYYGSINDLKNQAYEAGANYIQLTNSKDDYVTQMRSSSESQNNFNQNSLRNVERKRVRVSTTSFGNAYRCPDSN